MMKECLFIWSSEKVISMFLKMSDGRYYNFIVGDKMYFRCVIVFSVSLFCSHVLMADEKVVEKPISTVIDNQDRIVLNVDLSLFLEKTLVANYSIQNNSQEDIYLVDVGIKINKGGLTASVVEKKPLVVFNELGQWVISSALKSLDPLVNLVVPPHAYTSILKPGAFRRGVMKVPLPLVPGNKLVSQNMDQVEKVKVSTLLFQLGYIPSGSRGLIAEEQELDGVKVWRLSATAYQYQKILTIDLVSSSPLPALLSRNDEDEE